MLKTFVSLALGTLAAGAVVGGISAAPSNAPNAEFIDLVCDNGQTYPIVVNGNGEWTPGHAPNGVMLIPTAFPSFTGVFTDAEGNEFPIDDPPVVKGSGKAGMNQPQVACTFEISFSDPTTGESLQAVGTVEGFVVGKPAR